MYMSKLTFLIIHLSCLRRAALRRTKCWHIFPASCPTVFNLPHWLGWMHARLCRALLVGCAPSRAEGAMKWRKLRGETTVYKSAYGNIGGPGLIAHSIQNGQKHISVFQNCRGQEPPRQRRVSNFWMTRAFVLKSQNRQNHYCLNASG